MDLPLAGNTVEDDLVQENYGLVIHIYNRSFRHWVENKAFGDLDEADLLTAGLEGLYHAIRRFEPGRNFRFSSYASPCIKGYMQTFIRDSYHKGGIRYAPVANPVRKVSLFKPVSALSNSYGKFPTRPHGKVLLLIDLLEDKSTRVDEGRILARSRLVRALGELTPREQRIVCGYYLEEMLLEELGIELGLSRERIRQVKLKALNKLKIVLMRDRGEDNHAGDQGRPVQSACEV